MTSFSLVILRTHTLVSLFVSPKTRIGPSILRYVNVVFVDVFVYLLCNKAPSRRDGNDEENLAMLFHEIPILKLLCSCVHIDPGIPYDVDGDVQLVCKYLWACEDERRINRLFHDFINVVIKFSTSPDLCEATCHQLLKKYMPDHISSTKITQKLFIK